MQQRLLEIFISVLSPELSDAYLTTLFEQEVHNSVCMSQELARRCLWLRESFNNVVIGQSCASPSTLAPTPEASIAERENRRRVNAVQKTLKVRSITIAID